MKILMMLILLTLPCLAQRIQRDPIRYGATVGGGHTKTTEYSLSKSSESSPTTLKVNNAAESLLRGLFQDSITKTYMVNMSGGIIQTAKFTCLKTGWAITNLLPVTDDKMLRKMDYLDFYKSLTNGITFHVLAEKEIECWDCEGKGILKILNQKSKSESTNRNQKTDTYFNRICPTCKGKKNAKYKVLTTLIF